MVVSFCRAMQRIFPYRLKRRLSWVGVPVFYGKYRFRSVPLFDRTSFYVLDEVLGRQSYFKFFRPEKGEVVLDVGANIGVFSVCASYLLRQSGCIYAVEPNPYLMKFLLLNIEGLGNVKVCNIGFGAFESTGKLKFDPCAIGDGSLIILWRKNQKR